MKDIPEIVRELMEAEKLGRFHSKIQGAYEELEVLEEPIESLSDTSVGFIESNVEKKSDKNSVTDDVDFKSICNDIEFYRKIFELSPEAIVIIDRKGNILKINGRVYDWLGYKPEEILGKKILKLAFLPRKSRAKIKKNFILRMLGKEILPYDIEFIAKNEEKKIGRIRATTIKDNKKRNIAEVVLISDVTKQKEIEKALEKSEERFRQLYEKAPVPYHMLSPSGTITNVNETWCQTLEYTKDEVIGKSIFDFVAEDEKKLAKSSFEKKILNKKSHSIANERVYVTKDGEKRIFVIHDFFSFDKDKNVASVITTMEDITDRKNVNERIASSERKFRSIFENSAIAITFTDENERIVSWNRFAENLLGNRKEDLYMKPVESFYPPEEWKKIRSQDIRKKGMQHHLETKMYGKNNDLIDVDISLSVLKDQKGKITGSIGVIKDISDRKRAEKKIAESEDRYYDLFENATDLIQAVKPDGSFLYVNHAWKRALDYSDDELKNLSVFDIIHPDSKEHCVEIFKHVMSGESVDNIETSFVSKNGNVITVEGSVNCRFEDGTPVSTRGIFRDITEHKKFEEKLKEKIDELEKSKAASINIMEDLHETLEKLEKSQKIIKQKNVEMEKLNEIKSAFLNVTSHELRTPMSAIKGYIQMMVRKKLGDINSDQKNALDVVLRNTERLDHLIQDILDISRLESGTMKFVPYETNVGKLVEETAETMLSSAALKEIKIDTDISKEVPDLFIDPERIKQIIVNLTSNAIKFSPDGSVINIRVKKEKDDVLFELRDHGRGIPKDHQRRIFETFYQVDSGIDRKFGGAGLGLAISRGIVLAHGGRIWVKSKGIPGEGSTFKFTLPVKSVTDIEKRFKGADVFGFDRFKN